MLKVIPHRTVKGHHEESWEYDSAQATIYLVAKFGNRLFTPDPIRVCSPLRPRINSFVIVRRSATDLSLWELTSAVFDRDCDFSHSGSWCSVGPTALLLSCAPENVGHELLEL